MRSICLLAVLFLAWPTSAQAAAKIPPLPENEAMEAEPVAFRNVSRTVIRERNVFQRAVVVNRVNVVRQVNVNVVQDVHVVQQRRVFVNSFASYSPLYVPTVAVAAYPAYYPAAAPQPAVNINNTNNPDGLRELKEQVQALTQAVQQMAAIQQRALKQ